MHRSAPTRHRCRAHTDRAPQRYGVTFASRWSGRASPAPRAPPEEASRLTVDLGLELRRWGTVLRVELVQHAEDLLPRKMSRDGLVHEAGDAASPRHLADPGEVPRLDRDRDAFHFEIILSLILACHLRGRPASPSRGVVSSRS